MVQISLPPEVEAKLRERASASGENVSVYAARLVQSALAAPSVDELLAAARKQVAESGISDDELNCLGDELRTEVWQERSQRKPAP